METGYLVENLKYLRKVNNLTQQQFAEKLGIKRSTYAFQESHGFSKKLLPQVLDFVSNEYGYSWEILVKKDLKHYRKKITTKPNEEVLEYIEIIEEYLEKIKKKLNNTDTVN